MKIIYYAILPYGYGSIHEQSIDTEDITCICFDNKTVTIKEPWEDWSGMQHTSDNTYFRDFDATREQLIDSHKKMIAELQNEVRFLETATDYKDYSKRYNALT